MSVCVIDSNILSWKSKGFSDDNIKPPTASNKMLNPSVNYVGPKARVKFNGDCLKRHKNFIWSSKHNKHLNCLWNRKKCYKRYKCYKHKQLFYAGKLFIWCSQINKKYWFLSVKIF